MLFLTNVDKIALIAIVKQILTVRDLVFVTESFFSFSIMRKALSGQSYDLNNILFRPLLYYSDRA